MKNNLSNKEKDKLLKFMLYGKEFRFEISYSQKYLQKTKTIYSYFTPGRKVVPIYNKLRS